MRVVIHLGEPYWRTCGAHEIGLELESGARLADLVALLRRRWPALARDLDEALPALFVGEAQAEPHTRLADGDRVHMIWPVAGG